MLRVSFYINITFYFFLVLFNDIKKYVNSFGPIPLINQPEILLADEPTGSLDSNTSTLVMKQLQRLNTEHNQTIITVTHDANVAALYP